MVPMRTLSKQSSRDDPCWRDDAAASAGYEQPSWPPTAWEHAHSAGRDQPPSRHAWAAFAPPISASVED
jgi:hypothetical protein